MINDSLLHIGRDGKNLGTFSEEEVLCGLERGKNKTDQTSQEGEEIEMLSFYPHDLVWREGMAEWRPLGEMVEAWGLSLEAFNENKSSDEMQDIPPVLRAEPAWERRKEVGVVKAFFQTIFDVLLHPKRTFSQMSLEGGMKEVFPFYLFWGVFVHQLLLLPFLFITRNPESFYSPQVLEEMTRAGVNPQEFLVKVFWIIFAIFPISALVSIFTFPTAYQLSLKLLRFSHNPFKVTFKMMVYFSSAFSALNIFVNILSWPLLFLKYPFLKLLPVILGIALLIYYLYVFFIALRYVHSLSSGKAILAILLSMVIWILIMLLVILIASLLTALVAGVFSALHH